MPGSVCLAQVHREFLEATLQGLHVEEQGAYTWEEATETKAFRTEKELTCQEIFARESRLLKTAFQIKYVTVI